MLQPTPQLLIRPAASVAASLRLLTHPKLPLTPAESRSLLNALTTSFRHELAQEHGESSVKSSAVKSISESNQTKDVKPRNGAHTERHLRGILTNPLFRALDTSDLSGVKDPMDVFDQACARGLMTYSRARACLIAKKALLKRYSDNNSVGAMRRGDSGAKVLNWLLSTGAKEHTNWLMPWPGSEEFATKRDIIFEFVIREGREQSLWDIFEYHVANRTKNVDLGLLLYHISKATANWVGSMDPAYQSLIKAKGILLEHGFSEGVFQRVSKSATLGLISATLNKETPHCTDALYEDFCRKVQANSDCLDYSFSRYRLALHHPSKPDATQALTYLKDIAPRLEPEDFHKGFLWLAFDTARVLLRQDKVDDARWVMDFLQKYSSKEIGVELQTTYNKTERRVLQVKSEESNLALLDGLGLGLRPT